MEDWKKELKSRFDDFQMREPEGLWDSIEKELPDKKRKVIPFGWITLAAVTAAAAALAVFVVPKGRNAGKLPEPIAVLEEAPASFDENVSIPAEIPSAPISPVSAKAIAEVFPVQNEQILIESVMTEEVVGEVAQEGKEKAERLDNEFIDSPIVAIPKKKGGLSYKISTSASRTSTTSSSGYGNSILGTRSDISLDSYSNMMRLLSTNQATEKTVTHRMPARISFDVVYNITDRIGIGTGLSRTSLSSNIHSGTSTMYTDSEQKMVLLGIPLSIYYGIPLSAKRIEVYASVGGMWEKAVDYSLDSHEYIGGQKTSTKSHSEEVPSYNQWSVNAVAGVRISLSEKSAWSVFAEGGAVRHFDNGSEIPTIYNDKPLMPLVNFGLRYSITMYPIHSWTPYAPALSKGW